MTQGLEKRQITVRADSEGISERVVTLSPATARLLSESICRHHHMVAIEYLNGVITVAGDPDSSADALAAVRQETDSDVVFLIAQRDEVDAAIASLFVSDGLESSENGSREAEPHHRNLIIPPRLGDSLAARNMVSEEQLRAAINEQERSGGRIGEILVHAGALNERDLQSVVAERVGLPTVDLSAHDPSEAPTDAIPELVLRSLRVVPFGSSESTLYLAVPEILTADELATLGDHTSLEIDQFLSPSGDIEAFRRSIYSEEYTRYARLNLMEQFPDSSAHSVLSGGQKVFLGILAIVLIACLIWNPITTLIVIFGLASVFYLLTALYKLIAGFSALNHKYLVDITEDDLDAMDEHNLPVYTILIPLFREAAVIPYLVDGINSLDYPKHKLDVKLLCEQEDDETIDAIRELNLPPHFDTVVVPPSQPQTKPKA
jgi:hypothetical protein